MVNNFLVKSIIHFQAQTAINKVPENLSNSKIVKSSRDELQF